MAAAAHFAGIALACYVAAGGLSRAAWVARSPRVAILCWQAIGLAVGLAAIGLPIAVGLAPYRRGTGRALLALAGDLVDGRLPAGLTVPRLGLVGVGVGIAAVLLGSTARSVLAAGRVRRRHRQLLNLVARDDPAAPGALVLDHPSAAAYCLPGVRPRVVVSAGALSLLDRAELAAVLSHERAHADERHDLVLLPFTALCEALPWVRWVHRARHRVALLVEMRADDRARRQHTAGPLANALLRFATAGPRSAPAGALGLADRDLDARLARLLVTGRPPVLRRALSLGAAGALLLAPVCLFLS
ncbi:M56 family metallopeptidase [Plantactinospora sp. KBS50]|uniref:M56 family metallopeptidase n=1 Tax=Plantactinospora sp. KBS50 TaxID=2024580 RepID=UPI000BAAB75F|nr:M56 family metallopeptidase [Plantactinospora sp. KBS50]ASW56724.1 peptidase M48 [Plantactinospora sp. KBS50]